MGTRVFGPSTNANSFQGRLLFLFRNRIDTGVTNATELGNWINDAYTYLCHPTVHHFREMQDIETITLATGDNDYSITSLNSKTVVAIRWVTFIDATSFTNTAQKRKLNPRDMRWFEERSLSSAEPNTYAIDGETLYISGVPRSQENGKLLRVGFYREPTILSADADVTVLPRYWDRILLKFAQGFAEVDLGYRDLALETFEHAQTLANNAMEERELEAEDTGFKTEFIVRGQTPAAGGL